VRFAIFTEVRQLIRAVNWQNRAATRPDTGYLEPEDTSADESYLFVVQTSRVSKLAAVRRPGSVLLGVALLIGAVVLIRR
jgi:hypothetical protein